MPHSESTIGAVADVRPVLQSGTRPSLGGTRVPLWRRPGFWLFFAAAACYIAGGVWLSFAKGSLMSDALSRTANAYYTLFSRDPHLAAIGFVWNPLPSLVQIPMLPLAKLWTPFAAYGVAATIQSGLFMAGAVCQFRRTLLDMQVRTRTVWALTALFALHPEILYFGMNGMSEAGFLFFLVIASRQLILWTRACRADALAAAGLALGAAYLTRYEAVAAGMAATAFVAGLTYVRSTGDARERRAAALADALVIGVPVVCSVAVWAVTSWLIVGTPFAQLTSNYGNSALIGEFAGGISELVGQYGGPLGYLFSQSLVLVPTGVVIVAAVALLHWRRRDVALLGPGSVLGGAYAFSVLALIAGQTFGWLRFSIMLVPLVALAAGGLLAPAAIAPMDARLSALRPGRGRLWQGASSGFLRTMPGTAVAVLSRGRGAGLAGRWTGRISAHARRLGAQRGQLADGLVCLLLAVALPVCGIGLLNPGLAREESYFLTGALAPDRAWEDQRKALHRYDQDRALAEWLDAQALPRGAVILDVGTGFGVFLSSGRPEQFVITTDRDFQQILSDPTAHGVRYLVTRSGSVVFPRDAISIATPDIDTDPSFRLVRVERNPGDLPPWRVYATTE